MWNPKAANSWYLTPNFTAKASIALPLSLYPDPSQICHFPVCWQVCQKTITKISTNDNVASINGSLHVLLPIEDAVYKRLQLLQGQLTRNVQHVAGLNPRAFRYVKVPHMDSVSNVTALMFRLVRNEYTSRPLTKGILDDGLLNMFDELPVSQQVEMTRQIASERSIIVRDLTANIGSW